MRARKFLLIAVAGIAAVVVARALGLWVGGQLFSSPTPPSQSPALVFAPDDLTFGPIPESEPIERDLRVTNTSSEPITVEQFSTSCSCLGVEPAGRLTLAVGETKTLCIKLKASIPANAKLSADGLFDETVTVTAMVSSSVHPTGRLPAEFRYTVRQTVAFDPPAVLLGVVSHREPLLTKATLTFRSPITDVRVLPHPEWEVSVTAKNTTRELSLTPTRPGIPRVVNDSIQIVPVGTDGEDRPTRPLIVRGEVKSDVFASPADIPLGRVKVGTTVEESFRLASLAGRKFDVVSVTSDSHALAVQPDANDKTLFTVRATITEDRDKEGVVTVISKQDDGQLGTLRVTVRYSGE